MAWIRTVSPESAEGELKSVYEHVTKARGKVANVIQVHSIDPPSMDAHLHMYMHLMFGRGGLTREERELIAVVVSSANDCAYCLQHHSETLGNYWKDEPKVRAVSRDFRQVVMGERPFRICEYAEKLTLHPGRMVERDVLMLREAGLSDEEILSVNLIASYFNLVNRVALGLGVDFSDAETKGYPDLPTF
ncbi:MAG: peroxidase-related enzyme [Thermoplasmata archaeon]|nr:peroxidase-related enzyme [Thermoplasmata archaeon]